MRKPKMTNKTNLIPVDDCVVIQVEKIKDVTGGGIILTEEHVDREQLSQTEGVLSAVGDFAFYDLIQNNKVYPKIGDRVFFKRHSGIMHGKKEDEIQYRIIADKDVYAFEPKGAE